MPPIPLTFTMWFADDEKVSFTGYSYEDILEQQKAWMIAQNIREEKRNMKRKRKRKRQTGMTRTSTTSLNLATHI